MSLPNLLLIRGLSPDYVRTPFLIGPRMVVSRQSTWKISCGP